MQHLLDAPMRPGTVDWIGIRPARRVAVQPLEAVELDPAHGLVGDRYAGRTGTRQVTLIGRAAIRAIAEHLGRETIDPRRLRRNIVCRGLNLAALRGRRVRAGSALLEITGPCDPCSRMEEEFGPGGYNAVRGHGGVTARVLEAGRIALGDPVIRLD